MSNKLARDAFNKAIRLIVFQVLFVVICAIIFMLTDDVLAAKSAMLGGAIYVLPNFVFTKYAFRYMGARQSRDVASSFALGELLKLLLTIVFFILVLKFVEVKLFALYSTFALAIATQLFAPYFMNKKLG